MEVGKVINKVERMKCDVNGLGIVPGCASSLAGVARGAGFQSNATLGGSRKMNTMKKLMFAAVACAAITGLAVESKNVVGYNSNALRQGSIAIAPQFQGIGSADGSYDLQQITCNDAADTATFTILDEVGLDTGFYSWTIWYDPLWTFTDYEKCWINGDGTKAEGVTIHPGDALWVSGSSTEQLFMSSGEVGQKDVSVVLRKGSLMTGNSSPVAIDLQDIVCNDAADTVTFTILDEVGLDTGFYSWTIWYDPLWTFTDYEKCWINGDGTKAEGVTIEPGQGLWVTGSVDPADPEHPDPTVDQIITFPGVEL